MPVDDPLQLAASGRVSSFVWSIRSVVGTSGLAGTGVVALAGLIAALASPDASLQPAAHRVLLIDTEHAHADLEARACQEAAAAILGKLARASHLKAAKTKDVDAIEKAERLYQLKLDTFPGAADHALTRYLYSEVLWLHAEIERDPRRQAARWQAYACARDAVSGPWGNGPGKASTSGAHVIPWKTPLHVDSSIELQCPR